MFPLFDLIRDGIKAAEGLATLPLRAANELAGPHNPTFGEILSLSERLIRMPFAVARRALGDSEANLDTKGADPSRIRRNQGHGPGLHNLRVNPKVTVLSDLETEPGANQRQAELRVTGLLCGL